MKVLKCSDLLTECDYVAKADTNEEVKKLMWEQIHSIHPEVLRNMSHDDKMMLEQKMEQHIVEEAF